MILIAFLNRINKQIQTFCKRLTYTEITLIIETI